MNELSRRCISHVAIATILGDTLACFPVTACDIILAVTRVALSVDDIDIAHPSIEIGG
jgi:hypothetical protein